MEHDNDKFVHNEYETILSLSLHILCLITQSLVITHFYVKMRKPKRQISKSIKFAAISVIAFVWIAILFDILIGVGNIFYSFSPNYSDIYCYSIYYMRYIRIILFEVVLSVFWMIRLNHTFRFSALEIKLRTFVIIFGLIIIISTSLSIIFIVLFNDLKIENIIYLRNNIGNICYINWNKEILYLLLASQILILMENISFAIIFWIKLRSLHLIVINSADLSNQSGQRIERIYQLQQKHTLLATVPILVTICVYTLFDISNYFKLPISTLYFLTNIDMIIKCLCMLLFFKFYQRRFGQFCCCCIKCCGYTNDELFSYFNPNKEYRKHHATIYQAVEKANIRKQQRKERAKSIKNGTLSPDEEEYDDNNDDDDDEFNEDASRSYHEPDELIKHLSLNSDNNIKHHIVISNEYESDEEYEENVSYKYSANDMNPMDRIDPKHQNQAIQWIEELMAIKLNNKKPPKFSSIDENEEKSDDIIDIEQNEENEEELEEKEIIDIDFFDKLRDGIILCKLLNRIKPGICKGYKRSNIPFVHRTNLQIFIDGCKELGLREIDIFDTNDLYDKKRLSAVLKCIFAVSAKAKELKNYNGPTIGYKFSERNERCFSLNTMNKSKTAMPFLTKGGIQMERTMIDSYGVIKVTQ